MWQAEAAGKMLGAWYGEKITHSEPVVRKYFGMRLFAQGGVAVGLSIMASQHLSGIQRTPQFNMGDAIPFAVTATTLIVQLIGPPMVKWAITLAGESGRNITKDDIITTWKASGVLIDEMRQLRISQMPVLESENHPV